MSSSINAVGFDFGTTYSKTAVVDKTERPVPVQNSRGDYATPSVVYFENGEPSLVGVEAVNEGFVHPDRVFSHFKLGLGSKEVLFRGKEEYTAEKLAAVMIRSMKEDVERRTNTAVDRAPLSCPANYRDDSREALLSAARSEGIKPLGLISEPAAAALAYAHGKQYDETFLVSDLGGGTLDASVVEVAGNQITVKATDGIPQLGGRDFTARIEERILEQFSKEAGFTPTKEDDPLFYQEAYQKAEAAKKALGQRDKTTVVIGCRGKQSIVEIKRKDFISASKDLFDQCCQCCENVVQGAGCKWNEIGSLILVGGSSRMPHLQQLLKDLTGLTPKMDIEPDRAVAIGAALKARLLLGEAGVLPHPNIFVREVSSHPLGVAVLRPGTRGEENLIQSAVVPRNTPIPAQRTDCFFLEHENQDIVMLVILQGEDGAPIKSCLTIGKLVLDGLPKEAKRTKRIRVDYQLDGNGMAKVTACDLVSGKTGTVSVNCKHDGKPRKRRGKGE